MWKPGSTKPQPPAASSSSPSSPPSQRGDEWRSGTGAADDDSSQRAGRKSEPMRTKALSGATLNMRFMKRKSAEPTSAPSRISTASSPSSSTRRAASASVSSNRKTTPPMPSGAANGSGAASTPSSTTSRHEHQSRRSPGLRAASEEDDDDDDVVMAAASCTESKNSFEWMAESSPSSGFERVASATPAEVHGRTGSLLGRRSFGGFNPSAERNWTASFRYATGKTEDEHKGRMRRYERPIGNLEAKMGSGSAGGRKRKKTTISDVS